MGSGGDGSYPLLAFLGRISGLAVDTSGNLYLSDLSNNVIRKASKNRIATIAGTAAVAGSSGDGSAASSCKFNRPSSVGIDSLGNVYVGDALNAVIRKISTTGIVSRIAGVIFILQ
jgi:hypothetical protein